MARALKYGLVMVFAMGLVACDKPSGGGASAPASVELDNEKAKVGYAIGATLGTQLKRGELEVDPDAVLLGLQDVLAERDLRLDQEELIVIDRKLRAEQQAKAQIRYQKAAMANLEKGKTYLEENAAKPDVTMTESGLQYKVVTKGSGANMTADSVVKMNYEAKTIDGRVIDTTEGRDAPVVIAVASLLPGMIEALQLMNAGSVYEFVIPPQLAYGAGSKDGRVGPQETILFTVELIGETDEEPTPIQGG